MLEQLMELRGISIHYEHLTMTQQEVIAARATGGRRCDTERHAAAIFSALRLKPLLS